MKKIPLHFTISCARTKLTKKQQEQEVELIAHLREPSKIQLQKRKDGSPFYPKTPTEPIYEIEIADVSLRMLNRLNMSHGYNKALHIHMGEDGKAYVCYPGYLTSEESVKLLAKAWLTLTVFTILTGIDPNYIEGAIGYAAMILKSEDNSVTARRIFDKIEQNLFELSTGFVEKMMTDTKMATVTLIKA